MINNTINELTSPFSKNELTSLESLVYGGCTIPNDLIIKTSNKTTLADHGIEQLKQALYTFELKKEDTSVQLEIKELLEKAFSFVKIANYKELEDAYSVLGCSIVASGVSVLGNVTQLKDGRKLVVKGAC